MNRRAITSLIAVLVVVLAIGSYASPYWTLYQMRSAIETRDADKFSQYVDFPALRENVKGQILARLGAGTDDPAKAGNPFANIGKLLAGGVVEVLLQAMISPSGVMALMEGEKPAMKLPPPKPAPPPAESAPPAAPPAASAPTPSPTPETRRERAREALRYSVDYRGLNRVDATATRENGERITLTFRRAGPWSWRWAGIDLAAF
jgi:hypothetical protein